MAGVKHLIECHCYLAIFKKNSKIPVHKFPVYSKLDKEGRVIEKIVKCNNCEALHKIIEIGKKFNSKFELVNGNLSKYS